MVSNLSRKPATKHSKVDDFQHEAQISEYVWKFVVEGEVNTFAEMPFVKENFNGERSWIDRVDFAAKGNSKGNALTCYIEPLGINLDECIAVGDNHNDISMLKAVGLGVAMQNADDTVKGAANLITQKITMMRQGSRNSYTAYLPNLRVS